MPEFFQNILDSTKAFWEKVEKKDRRRFILIAGVSLAAIVIAVVFLSRTSYDILYRNMDPAEAGEVVNILNEMGIKNRVEQDGTILVPSDKVNELSLNLATQGYPKSGFTYEIFAAGQGMGTTDYEKHMYAKFQLEDKIARTISLNPNVRQAVVTISEGNQGAIFKEEMTDTTASVMLVIGDAGELSADNVKAIERLVSTAVEGLRPENISITDQNFSPLNRREEGGLSSATTIYEYESVVRDQMERAVMRMLSAIFGADGVRVGVNVRLDFDKKTSERVTFSPVVEDRGIEVSYSDLMEKAVGPAATAAATPGMDTNGAAVPNYPEDTGAADNGSYTKTLREANLEVNRLVESVEQAQGIITDLNASIIIHSEDPEADKALTTDIVNIVANTIGVSDPGRISVMYTELNGVKEAKAASEAYEKQIQSAALFDLIKTIALYLIILLCVLALVINTLRLFRRKKSAGEEAAEYALKQIGEAGDGQYVLDEYGELVRLATEPNLTPEGKPIEVTKSAARVRIEEFIEKNPEAVANMLRTWMSDTGKGGQK